jgi:hypothetical protein
MKALLAWARQPTSVAGLSAAFGTFSALVLHQVSWVQAAPLLAGAIISIALPDNTVAKADAQGLTENLIAKFRPTVAMK